MGNLYLDNWIEFNGDQGKINHRKEYLVPDNLTEALVRQARIIYENHKDISVFVSGGIDSQMIAYAFKMAEIPVNYVFMKVHYNDRYNRQEYFLADQFARQYNIALDCLEVTYDKQSFTKLLANYHYFSRSMRLGSLIQCDVMSKYHKERGQLPVHGVGNFTYKREGTTCKGLIPNPNTGSTDGTNDIEAIPFFFHSPQLLTYYESVHKSNKIIQWHQFYQPKNFAYTELGWTFRPKLFSAEQMYSVNDKPVPLNFINVIDYGLDRTAGAMAMILNHAQKQPDDTVGVRRDLIKLLDLDQTVLQKLLENKPEYKKTYIELYNFETDVEPWS